ncbi:hypothetical protein [Nocardiopsis sp. NPDC006938]|uniref:hypothetical protein n=1 Tax=Nocardiopsis sp. NPDC006938 TaxID=3364337 RepID=UPI003683670E
MPNRTLSFAYTACALFAVLIAYLLAIGVERLQYTLEDTRVVWISENDESSDAAEVAAAVQRVAEDHDTVIGYGVLDVNDPYSVSHLYLALPDSPTPQARWLEEGYPGFDPGFTVRTHPLADFEDVGPNGHYLVFGSSETETALRAELAELGLYEAPGVQTTRAWHFFTGGHLFHLSVVALLAAVTAAGAGVLLASRDYGVWRLQGRSYLRVLAADLLKVARLAAVVLPLVTAGTLVFLGPYNGWNQLGLFSLMALVFLGLLTAACLLAHAAALGLVYSTSVLASLKGRLPVRSTYACVYLVRLPVLVLTLVVLGNIVTAAQGLRDQRVQLDLAEAQGDTSFPSLSANYGWADEQAVDDELGPWLREADSRGDMVLVVPSDTALLSPPSPDLPPTPGSERPLLFVNDTYLGEQEVLAPSGERYGPGGSVRVLVPEGAAADVGAVTADAIGSWLDLHGGPDRAPRTEVLPLADGQTLYTYAAKGLDSPRPHLPLVHDAVVVVLPNAGVLSDSAYVSYMTTRSTVFPDPEVVEDHRERDPTASRYIAMVEPLSTSARHTHSQTLTVLRGELFNLVGAAAVLLLTGMAACVIHVRSRAQEIFARHICGWTFPATHRRLLLTEGAITLIFLGGVLWDTLSRIAAAANPATAGLPTAAPTGAEPLYALGIAAACLLVTVTALALFHRRVVREGASRA